MQLKVNGPKTDNCGFGQCLRDSIHKQTARSVSEPTQYVSVPATADLYKYFPDSECETQFSIAEQIIIAF